jgi:hypothetical protein
VTDTPAPRPGSTDWDLLRDARVGSVAASDLARFEEMLRRWAQDARLRIQYIAEVLTELGWVFRRDPLVPVPPQDLERFEQVVGQGIPLALAVTWEEIGAVDLTGGIPGAEPATHTAARARPDAEVAYADPLQLWEPRAAMGDVAPTASGPASGWVHLASDHLSKAGISGGDPSGFPLPCDQLDPRLDRLWSMEGHSATLTQLIDRSIQRGGFPGFPVGTEPEWLRRLL